MDTSLDDLGGLVLPALERLVEDNSAIRAAMVCTDDGLNLAAVGLEQANVGRIAALTSSLRAVASAHVSATSPVGDSQPHVSISVEETNTVALAVPADNDGRLLLVAVADGLALGMLLVAARRAAGEVAEAVRGAGAIPA